MDDAQLDEYRRTWTSDVPASRDMRYQTESRRAGSNMPLKFQTSSVRMLPGTKEHSFLTSHSSVMFQIKYNLLTICLIGGRRCLT